jgi:hypothetical protein
MRHIRSIAAALFAVGIVALAAAPAGAAAGDVSPRLECIFITDETTGAYTAVWGYDNRTAAAVDVHIGSSNKFEPNPEDRGQPTTFDVGSHTNVLTTSSSGDETSWKLLGGTATAKKDSKTCASPPVPQGTDSPQAFLLIAVAAGVVMLASAASGWMIHRRRRSV